MTEPFALVFRTTDQVEFDLVKGLFRSQGIPFTTIGDATAEFGTAIQKNALDENWEDRGCQLFVPARFAASARSLLKRAER